MPGPIRVCTEWETIDVVKSWWIFSKVLQQRKEGLSFSPVDVRWNFRGKRTIWVRTINLFMKRPYDGSIRRTVFADLDARIPAQEGDKVAAWKSINGFAPTMRQPDVNCRPIYRKDHEGEYYISLESPRHSIQVIVIIKAKRTIIIIKRQVGRYAYSGRPPLLVAESVLASWDHGVGVPLLTVLSLHTITAPVLACARLLSVLLPIRL